ncbi:MAG: GGDEF domain-containing protein, partial [Pseudomonadota bacterium]|nr:GGDEF domain-containing protein [Pseudomonadota bacterium]
MSWQRIRTDFRFAIITLFSMVAVLFVLPFAIYRFAQGQILAGIGDTVIVLVITAAGIYVWRGGNMERASLVAVCTFNIGCLMVAHLVGVSSALWMYPVLMANFMLIDRRIAVAISTVSLLVLAFSPGIFAGEVPRAAFVVTAGVVCVFGYIFAYQTYSQHAQLEALASHDPLTGIQNRRAMERELAIAIETRRRQRTPYALAVVDLDRFKR